jgi:flotillin
VGEAEANMLERIKTADANARSVEGENIAKIAIANSEAERREQAAEAERKALAAEKVKHAMALEQSYSAEQSAEVKRAERDKASRIADIVIPAEIEKQRVEIEAEAHAEMTRRKAKGEADAIFFKMEAEAKGIYEILTKQAEGFERLVKAAGDNSRDAVMMMIVDKLPELVKMQSDAIKNIKIDKVTVWDGGGNGNGTGSSTANFLSNIYKSVPPLQDVFNMAGMDLPNYLKGSLKDKDHDNPPPTVILPGPDVQ